MMQLMALRARWNLRFGSIPVEKVYTMCARALTCAVGDCFFTWSVWLLAPNRNYELNARMLLRFRRLNLRAPAPRGVKISGEMVVAQLPSHWISILCSLFLYFAFDLTSSWSQNVRVRRHAISLHRRLEGNFITVTLKMIQFAFYPSPTERGRTEWVSAEYWRFQCFILILIFHRH